MNLANQKHIENPLDETSMANDSTTTNLKCFAQEYSIQLDQDTIKYLTMKKKTSTFVVNEDEHEARMLP